MAKQEHVINIPRRARVDQWTDAEKAIDAAVQAVEHAGTDVRLTDAVNLLLAARHSVADCVDGVTSRRSVAEYEPPPVRQLLSRESFDAVEPLAQQVRDFDAVLTLSLSDDVRAGVLRDRGMLLARAIAWGVDLEKRPSS